ncbi:uncharacterized protein [Notothenia coriiceps]|uniref:Ubiquitin-like protease family profile domain-containing protein n=1 Tax=Notothenia coriiceps TaxID=8208 RepID=A0A6I9N973_9TELE|nr:PREDICTED: uncharacterized protein LOC104948581 [Notothenia coriiceps]
MVHSGSASPMTTSSTHLTVPASAPSLQGAPPLVPPPGDITHQDLTQTPSKPLHTDLSSNSESTQPSTPISADTKPHVVIKAEALTTFSSPASAWSAQQTPTASQGSVNGRTSGRKRTPKACDCCGPNSAGHNAHTSGRGRGRGRGRGLSRDLGDTPKRKVDGQLTRIKCFDLAKEAVKEAECDHDRYEKVQRTVVVADTESEAPGAPPVTVSLQEEPIKHYVAPEKKNRQIKGDVLIEGLGGKVGSCSRDVAMLGMAGRGFPLVRGRGARGRAIATSASKMKVDGERKLSGLSGVVIHSKSHAISPVVSMQKQGQNNDSEIVHEEQTCPSSVNPPIANGDTVNLSDTEEETKEGNVMTNVTKNGLVSTSLLSSPGSMSGSPKDLDSEMQVDKTPDRTVPVTQSNGKDASPTVNNCSTLMEVDASHPAPVAPSFQGPITVCSMQHSWALRDHRLYCNSETWDRGGLEEEVWGKETSEGTNGQVIDGERKNKESLEQLTDMIHEFLESFYMKYGSFNPLSENDVLEHLKKKGNTHLSNRGLDIKREMTRYRAGLASAPIAGFMLSYNKHTLGLEDLSTLEEQNWLNDQIINMYGELIMEATQHKVHFFNSFFHKQLVAKGYEGVKRWTKKVDLFSKWLLLFPIHLEIHWSLITVTMATKTISYYDSQGIVFRHTTDNIMKYLQSEAREKQQTAFQKGWKITIIKGIPQQRNDSDCGVFVLEYCRCLSVRQPLLFSQEDMPRIRKRIHKELCDCRLND